MILLAILLLIVVPGIGLGAFVLRRPLPLIAWCSLSAAFGLLWSTWGSFVLTLFHIPLTLLSLTLLEFTPLLILLSQSPLRREGLQVFSRACRAPRDFLLWVIVAAFLAIPLIATHHGLPTGDIQKALFWARDIPASHRLPTYAIARGLNRDPADFLTPGLHTFTAAVAVLGGDPLRGGAWVSFTASLILAGLASALAALITSDRLVQLLAFLFAALNGRFLRYAFFPGYHYQNLLGEILILLALVTVLLSLERGTRRRVIADRRCAFMALAAIATLPLVHQFTTFLSFFLFTALAVVLSVRHRHLVYWWWQTGTPKRRRRVAGVILAAASLLVSVFIARPFRDKLSTLFTTTPHLTSFIVPVKDYPALLGPSLIFFGILGVVFAFRDNSRRRMPRTVLALATWIATIGILGQGPRFFLDIPSARTLFYATTPLAVCAAYAVIRAVRAAQTRFPAANPALMLFILSVSILPFGQAAAAQLRAVANDTRVNATVTPATLALLDFLRTYHTQDLQNDGTAPNNSPALLSDDWNRRRLTWAILSPYRMLSRVGGDLRVIADEARQSPTRAALYDAHLDYEKIFMAGNLPLILPLMQSHDITLLATTNGVTDDVFRANPLLEEVFRTEEATIYARRRTPFPDATAPDSTDNFFRARTTLVNDVGDAEDVLSHTAISLASTRISGPLVRAGRTVRTTTAVELTLRVNVGSFIRPLWDPDRNNVIDVPLELFLRARGERAPIAVRAGSTILGTLTLSGSEKFTDTTIKIPAHVLQIDDRGIATITLDTEDHEVTLDRIAIGLRPSEAKP